ncbi:transcription factor EMB1444-like isoform X2 [Mercurialis annua]|uniref:transcription factor EMB1444-like isoform X2 n=1 Tax=Mercurialis annua TaxID=3986 RepID=UPI0024AFC89D|nr:transcription factor EMB1444-like isoform X2 [Mercurialis annua]
MTVVCISTKLFEDATILLVPVLPHGVLQLGSLEEIAEDANIVTYAKGKFSRLHNFGENTVPFTLKEEYQSQLSSPLISSSIELLNEPSSSAFISMKTEYLDHLFTSNIFEQEDATFQPPLTFQNTLFPTGGDIAETFASEIDNEIDHIPFAEVPSPSISMTTSQLETAESKLLELSCLMEELEAYSEDLQGNSASNYYNVGVLGECFNEVMNVYPASASNMAWEPFCGKYTDNKLESSFLDFPKDSELHKALEPASRKQTNEKLWDLSRLVDNTCSTLPSKTEPSWFARGEAEYLLEAVVANACSISDVITLKKSTSFNSYDNFSGYTSASPRPKEQQNASALVKDNSKPQNRLTSSCIAEDKDADSSSDSLKSMMSTLINKEHVGIKCCTAEPKKGRKTVNSSKRRVRVCDNQKPRPRDRQLIQDRVKELREMVPNSAKCSIDGLLERTITHMMYLRSITNQAEKLRNCVHQEVAGRKNWRSFETKENDQNGTSWGFEIGNEFQVCPISVEDLPHPGQMVIEMLCNDHGLFLEIAQVIRNLELTILKGVLKSRSNNTWAHFVVEASKGFHRLDIFWPLMQLLQRKRKSLCSKI